MTNEAYHQLAEGLVDCSFTPAEAQGVLCGLLCRDSEDPIGRWLAELLGDQPGAAPIRGRLADAGERTLAELGGGELALTLWLPDDEQPLGERAEGVFDWGRGFLYGLGLAGVAPEELSPVMREILADIIALTELDLDEMAPDEQNERALTEIVEFIRVAAMHAFGDCAARPTDAGQFGSGGSAS